MKKRWILAGTMSLVCVSFLLAGIYRKQTEDKKERKIPEQSERCR